MIMTITPDFFITAGVEQCLVDYTRLCGPITSLDGWAHRWGITPHWVNHCAHSAARKGKIKLNRLWNTPGQPYQVIYSEEKI